MSPLHGKALRLGGTCISFSHCIWEDHTSLPVVDKNKTFYKQQVGGALVAGFDGFSVKFSLCVAEKCISVNFVKTVLQVHEKNFFKKINAENLVFGIPL